jgi:hypothetical protein
VASAAIAQTNTPHRAEFPAPLPNTLYPGRNIIPLLHVSPAVRTRTKPVVNLQPLITPRPPGSETSQRLVRVNVPFSLPAPLNSGSPDVAKVITPVSPVPAILGSQIGNTQRGAEHDRALIPCVQASGIRVATKCPPATTGLARPAGFRQRAP